MSTKVCLVKAMVFPVVMYACESWTIEKAECQRIDASELWCWRRLLRVPWEIQPVHPKGDQSSVFIGRTDAEAETPILWPPDVKNWLIWKDPDVGKDWRLEEKGMAEDEMVGWHHWLDGHGCGWTPGVGDGQGGLVCCGSWGHTESDTTERLNWTELFYWLHRVFAASLGTLHHGTGLGRCCPWAWLLCSLWDLSSLTRDQTWIPCTTLNGLLATGPPGKSLYLVLITWQTKG